LPDDVAASLAYSDRGAMIAPAGCGKTWTIARAVTDHGRGRELVLTHTHAGVDAIRRRLLAFRCRPASVHVDTIAGWCLHLAAAFPRTSRLSTPTPRTNDEYSEVYASAAAMLHMRPFREILSASYTGVYVDEYQDCTTVQHAVVLSIADTLPCRVVGDPLQSIFDFGDGPLVDWTLDVRSQFESVPGPANPHRWLKTNPRLGLWLGQVRDRLEKGLPVDLVGAPVQWCRVDDPRALQRVRLNACSDAADDDNARVVAIHSTPPQAQELARNLRGRYSCVERVDLEELYLAAARIDQSQGVHRALAVLDYSELFLTAVKPSMHAHRKSLESGKPTTSKKFREQRAALDAVATDSSPTLVANALAALRAIPNAVLSRRELLDDMRRACQAMADGEAPSLAEAARIVRNRTRLRGRRLARCAMGTTLRVKGLEFDHAVVLAPDQYDAQNLYVALTRGARSVSVVSASSTITPRPRKHPSGTPSRRLAPSPTHTERP
jgi:hypothetical protein